MTKELMRLADHYASEAWAQSREDQLTCGDSSDVARLTARVALQSAIEKLQAENERLKESLLEHRKRSHEAEQAYLAVVSELSSERDALAAKMATLEADAGRYRWLRDDAFQYIEYGSISPYVVKGQTGTVIYGQKLDAVIDTAKGGQHEDA